MRNTTVRLAVLAMMCALLGGCRDRSMPNNRVINKTKGVDDVIAEQTGEKTPEPSAETVTEEPQETADAETAAYETIDYDLTQSSETMLYSEVIDMGTSTETYVGKVVRVTGQYMSFHDDMSEYTYPTVVVLDATKCCATGLVFELRDEGSYPEEDAEFTVTGILDYPSSDDCPFPVLKEAVITQ